MMNELNESASSNKSFESDENCKGDKISNNLDNGIEANNHIVSEKDNMQQQNTKPNDIPEELLPILKKDQEHTFEQCLQQFELSQLKEIANYLNIPCADNCKQMIKLLQPFEKTKIEAIIQCYLRYIRITKFMITRSLKTLLDPMKKDRLLEYAKENGHELNLFDSKYPKSKIKSKLIEMIMKNERSLNFATFMKDKDFNLVVESNLEWKGDIMCYDPNNKVICKSDAVQEITQLKEIDITEEAIPNCDDIPENRFKIYVKHSWLIFAETAESIISAALDVNNASAKSSNKLSTGLEPVSIVVGGILTSCGFIGAMTGTKAVGRTIVKGFKKAEQHVNHNSAKSIHKILTGFSYQDSEWYQLVTSALGDIFIHYNLQFNHLLKDENLDFAWEKAMHKLAGDTIYRIFAGLKEIVKKEENMVQKITEPQFIIQCFLAGKSKGSLFSKITQNYGGKLGDKRPMQKEETKNKKFFEKFTTENFFDEPAIKMDDKIYGEPGEYLYRHSFKNEDVTVLSEKGKMFADCNWGNIEFEDRFSYMSEEKEPLLKELYNKLQSPEFHCLKEINQSLYQAHELMIKHLDQQEEHNKMSLKNQTEFLEISRQALEIQKEQHKQLQESIVNAIPEYNHTTQNVQLNVHIHNNNGYENDNPLGKEILCSQDLADGKTVASNKNENCWHSRKINIILPLITLLIIILVPFLLVHFSGSGTRKVGTCASNSNENFDESGSCQLSEFPLETLDQLYGPKTKQCCSSHSYTYIQHKKCEGKEDHLNKLVCTEPNKYDPVLSNFYNDCPADCLKDVSFKKNEFEINRTTGELKILKNSGIYQNIIINDYCLSYECSIDDDYEEYDDQNYEYESPSPAGRWSVVAKSCLCINSTKLNQLPYPQDLPKCCGNFPSDNNIGNENCVQNHTLTKSGLTCPGRVDKYHSFTHLNETYVQASNYYENITINKTDESFCIGPTWKDTSVLDDLPEDANFSNMFDMKLFQCINPCDGKTPCIRTCCDPGKMGLHCNETIPDSGYSKLASKLKIHEDDIQNHLYKSHQSERSCTTGSRQHLKPVDSCSDSFDLKLQENHFILHHKSTWKDYSENEFCLIFERNKGDIFIIGEVCMEPDSVKFLFYPYILLVSCLFMLVTILIYGFLYKELLKDLASWIMIHHTFTLMIAFFILALNQIFDIKDKSQALCEFSGIAIQFFFLASFALLTSLGFEVQRRVKYSNRRMMYELGACYGSSLLITIITAIVEASAPLCSEIAPHFGEQHCFFHGKSSKAIWFFLPMGISLTFNAVNFVFIMYKHYSIQIYRRKNNPDSTDQKIITSTMFMYIKLFSALGLFWIFEIIGGLSGSDGGSFYIFDILNMLQGFYIFVIHVCQPNVIKIIKDRINGRQSDDQETQISLPTLNVIHESR